MTGTPTRPALAAAKVIALVGQPNTGKSTFFSALTGHRVAIANYPGTTVEVSVAAARHAPVTVIDTPGLVSLPSQSEDERGTVALLLREPVSGIIQVGDAKNPRRTALLALQLAELGLPVVLALNMADEADDRQVAVDAARLEARLGIPVVPASAIGGIGIDEAMARMEHAPPSTLRIRYPEEIEAELRLLTDRLPPTTVGRRGAALLFLAGDPEADRWLTRCLPPAEVTDLNERRRRLEDRLGRPLAAVIQDVRVSVADRMSTDVGSPPHRRSGPGAALGWLTARPSTGLPILAAVLVAVYAFVGLFGAGTLVDLLEVGLFGELVNPAVTSLVRDLVPLDLLADFLVGDYGLWTMGMTYALALIFPIVTTFFLAFGALEDSGYLPRLAVLTNRVFRAMGLNGKAIVPMVLGLGCVTMATMSTRILESRRERLLATLLLALAIPCSAQLGVVMGLLAGVSAQATAIWAAVLAGVLLAVGWLASRLVPGDRSMLLIELPPLRRPRLGNVVLKTVARLEWYLREVVPLFLLGTAVLFVADVTGILPRLVDVARPLVTGWLGLPPETTSAFLMGFLRRDFGAAGLFMLAANGQLDATQLVVAIVAITLFVPCIASVLMIAKERGTRVAVGIVGLVFPLAFLVSGLLARVLEGVGWSP